MLNSLEIKNFRLLEDFTVEKLGRVNLIVGKNNSGKSTVLEALRIYAGNANFYVLKDIAISHDEEFPLANINPINPNLLFPYVDLFSGRQSSEKNIAKIIIGESSSDKNTLSISRMFVVEREESGNIFFPEFNEDWLDKNSDVRVVEQTLVTERNGFTGILKWVHRHFIPPPDKIFLPCSFIPTQFISTDELAKEWDNIVFTENEEIVKQALHIILPDFENLAFVGEQSKRTAKVKLRNLPRPVPLKSLGDGMIRVLQLALKLVSAKDGFLLIDEFENGLHYSTQEKIWALLFEMSERLNIQIFATTHSWDCIEAFTKVAIENETTEGVLFRMGKNAKKSNQGQVIATVFDKERLYNLTQADIEIR